MLFKAIRSAHHHPGLQQSVDQPCGQRGLRAQREPTALPQCAQWRRSDGAANVHHFPGTFYDYRWSTTLARRDKINTQATGAARQVPTAMAASSRWRAISARSGHDVGPRSPVLLHRGERLQGQPDDDQYYSGPDRGNEQLIDGVNLRLPSGKLLDFGNIDFDVNLIVSDAAFRPDGQLFFDIFTTDGFLGDVPLVNFAYAPFMEVLPRKYRFRILNGSMSRFYQLGFADANGNTVPFKFIANDGNLVVNPIPNTALAGGTLDEQGITKRYDVVVDFSTFSIGSKVRLVNRRGCVTTGADRLIP